MQFEVFKKAEKSFEHSLSNLFSACLKYKDAFLIIVFVTAIAFLVFTTQNLFHNHAARLPWLANQEQVHAGRWLGPIIGRIHYSADIPVFNQLLGIALGAIASIFIIRDWSDRIHNVNIILISLLIMVCPFNLAYFYYTFQTPLFFASWFFAGAAIALTSQFSSTAPIKSLLKYCIGTIFILFIFASYQASIGVLAVAALGRFLIRSAQIKDGYLGIFEELLILLRRGICVILGAILYALSLRWFPDTRGSLEINSIQDVVSRITEVSTAAFQHLWITQPDMLTSMKLWLLAALLFGIFLSITVTSPSALKSAITLPAWALLIISSKAIFFISDPGNIFQYRYNGSMSVLYAVPFYFILAVKNKLIYYLTRFAAIITIAVYMQADLTRQNVLMRGQLRDLSTFNRILYRIESLPNYNSNDEYDLIRVGALPRYRLTLLRSQGHNFDEIGDGHMDYGEITDVWVDEAVFRYLGGQIRQRADARMNADDVREEGLLEGREPWPHATSVFIDDNRIIIYIQ